MFIKITKKDRQEAKEFGSQRSCLLATAIRRTLKTKKRIQMFYNRVVIDNKKEYFVKGPMYRVVNNMSDDIPFYKERVVGLKFELCPLRN